MRPVASFFSSFSFPLFLDLNHLFVSFYPLTSSELAHLIIIILLFVSRPITLLYLPLTLLLQSSFFLFYKTFSFCALVTTLPHHHFLLPLTPPSHLFLLHLPIFLSFTHTLHPSSLSAAADGPDFLLHARSSSSAENKSQWVKPLDKTDVFGSG